MVLRTGADGELAPYGYPKEYVYDWDSTQLQTKIDLGSGQRVPTLEQVILLTLDAPKLQIHIEVKSPISAAKKALYNSARTCNRVRDVIDDYIIRERTTVTSSDPEILSGMEKARKVRWQYVDFNICQLLPNPLDLPKTDFHTRAGL